MTHLTRALCLLTLGLGCPTSLAREFEGSRENSVLLNGRWEFVFGDGSERAETAAGQRKIEWQQVTLPDLADSRVKIRVTPAGSKPINDLQIVAQVERYDDPGRISGPVQLSGLPVHG